MINCIDLIQNTVSLIVIDDDEIYCTLITRIARQLPYNCHIIHLHDEKEVLNFIKNKTFDILKLSSTHNLILIDIHLPTNNGCQILKCLQLLKPYFNFQYCFVSILSTEEVYTIHPEIENIVFYNKYSFINDKLLLKNIISKFFAT